MSTRHDNAIAEFGNRNEKKLIFFGVFKVHCVLYEVIINKLFLVDVLPFLPTWHELE